MFDNLPLDPREFLATMARLRQAGIIDSAVHVVGAGQGVFSWTPAYHKLLRAGRDVFNEPEFQAAWAAGDPLVVRAWIDRAAAGLADEPIAPGKPSATRRRRKSGKR
jgi:hypothetical protein